MSIAALYRFGCAVSMSLLLSAALVAQDSAAPAHAVPQGTVFLVRLTDALDTHTAKAGDHFQARLAEPLVAEDGQTISAGRKITGHISAVEPGLQKRLLLSFDDIETSHGWAPLIATVSGVPGEHALKQVGDEGEIANKGMTKEQIAEAVIVAAGEGAKDGILAHDKRAAATGAGLGAANGAVSAFESGHDLVLQKGTTLELRLDRNLTAPR
jgi:hypothetical protein